MIRFLFSVLLIGVLLAMGAAAGAQENRAPVLLRGPKLLTPAGTTCTGIVPEVTLYLAEGYVSREALETVYAMSLDELEERFVRYIERF